MIHPDARKAIGLVLSNGRLNGHCVFFSDRLAVTCTHVLPLQVAEIGKEVQIYLLESEEELAAQVVAFSPGTIGFKGADIAILRVNGASVSPTFVPLELSLKSNTN